MAKKMKQGYKARKDESIAMRKKKKRTKKQLKASRDESYGKWGSKAKKKGKINNIFLIIFIIPPVQVILFLFDLLILILL